MESIQMKLLNRTRYLCTLWLGISLLQAPGQIPVKTAEPLPLPVNESEPPASDNYALGPDSLPQPGVPAGKVFKFNLDDSKIYPHTSRTIKVYIPAAYDGTKPACVFVFCGGVGPKDTAPVVFDNLIARHEMPVTIAIGVSPGKVDSAIAPENPRFERSMELDSPTDRFPRFVLEEVLPQTEKHSTPDGKPILLSHDPNDRAVGGSSTGGIGAFNVAWQRPDGFRRVFTGIGTFVGMRGGERYNIVVRKTEPKPLRIVMEDGVHDQCTPIPEFGDWRMSNLTMERALDFAGYDIKHFWGVGTHNNQHAAAIFPDAMRWLWRDWPAPVQAKAPGNPILRSILLPGEDWQVAAGPCAACEHLVADPQGQVYFKDGDKSFRIGPDGKAAGILQNAPILGMGPDGKPYDTRAVAGLPVRTLTVRNNGDLYAVTENTPGEGELWLVRPNGQRTRLDGAIKGPSGLAFSPDGLWAFVAQSQSRWGLSYRVNSDGTLDSREPFYDLWVPDGADDSGAGDVCMDRDGRPYVATRVGVQIFDRNGRVTAILPLPGNEPATGICFGGAGFDTLYVACAGKVYKRKLRAVGAPPWASPIKLPHWGEG